MRKLLIVLFVLVASCTNPKIQYRTKLEVTLITGEKKTIYFDQREGEKLYIMATRATYTLMGEVDYDPNGAVRIIKQAVIDFKIISQTELYGFFQEGIKTKV
jgi:hypothetical protein